MPALVQEKVPYIILHVQNLETSGKFYCNFLGLTRRDYPVDSKLGKNAIALGIQGTTIVLMASDCAYFTADALKTGPMAPAAGQCHPSFEVDNLDTFHRDVKYILEELHTYPEFGKVECVQEPSSDEFGKMAIYRDPDGLLFSIVQKKPEPVRHGIVLSGGGAYGAFELGVLRHLATDSVLGMAGSAHPAPAVLTGTSVGAFNAALLACRLVERGNLRTAVEDLVSIWVKQIAGDLHNNGIFRMRGDILHSADPDLLLRPGATVVEAASDAVFFARDMASRLSYFAQPGSSAARLIKMFDMSAFFSIDPLLKLIENNISWDTLRQSACELNLATTDWTTGRAHEFSYVPEGSRRLRRGDEEELTAQNLCEAVLASTAIPGVFRPVKVHTSTIGRDGTTTRPFVDGGLVMNSPLNPAIDAHASVVHLICLNPEVDSLAMSPVNSTVDVFQRSLTTAVANHVATDLKRAKLINSIAGVARHGAGELYRAVTIHRYHPAPEHLGGVTGILDFSLEHIDALMAEGERAAREHNCTRAGCVLAS